MQSSICEEMHANRSVYIEANHQVRSLASCNNESGVCCCCIEQFIQPKPISIFLSMGYIPYKGTLQHLYVLYCNLYIHHQKKGPYQGCTALGLDVGSLR